MKGPIAPPQMCNGLMVPIVVFDQIYSFDRDALIKGDSQAGEDFGQGVRSRGGGSCSTASCRWPTTPGPPTSIAR